MNETTKIQFVGEIPEEYVENITYVISDDMDPDGLEGQLVTIKHGRHIILVKYKAVRVSEFNGSQNNIYSDKKTMDMCLGDNAIDGNMIGVRTNLFCDDVTFISGGENQTYPAAVYINDVENVYDENVIKTAIMSLYISQCEYWNMSDGTGRILAKNRHITVHHKPPKKSARS